MKHVYAVLLAVCLTSAATSSLADDLDRLERQARAGNQTAQLSLADIYLNTADPHYDRDKGKALLLPLAQSGNADAAFRLGQIASREAPDEARQWYAQAAAHGHIEAARLLCAAEYHPDAMTNWTQVVASCQFAADLKVPIGVSTMGLAYANGVGGVTADGQKAVAYLTQADTFNDPIASETLGRLYFTGDLIPQDYVKSAQYLRNALVVGRGWAAEMLAEQYEKGLGVPAEILEAARLYAMAVNANQPRAGVWFRLHPEITVEAMIANRANPFSDALGTWTTLVKQADGSTQAVDFRAGFSNQMADSYPDRAANDEVEGIVSVDCHWNTGVLDNCVIIKESPRDYGFGRATVKVLSKRLKIIEKEAWDARFTRKSYRATLKWVLG